MTVLGRDERLSPVLRFYRNEQRNLFFNYFFTRNINCGTCLCLCSFFDVCCSWTDAFQSKYSRFLSSPPIEEKKNERKVIERFIGLLSACAIINSSMCCHIECNLPILLPVCIIIVSDSVYVVLL